MFQLVIEMFSYPFMVRALLVGALIALCAAMLGVTLVLKRYSMIGDGLSHVGFGALAIASAMNAAPLLVAIPVVVAAAFFLLRLRETSHVKGDSAIALISTGALAVGVTVVSMTTGMNYLFGSILSMSGSDVWITAIVSIVVLILFVFFYHRIFAVTFDENFTRATGIPAATYNSLIALLTALVIVIGMRMMGSLLISSLVVFPAMTSMRLCRTFRSVMISAAVVSVVCLLLGLVISYLYATPTGASIVLCNMAAFFIYAVIAKIKGLD